VTTRREGNSIFYRRAAKPNEPLLVDLHNALWEAVDALSLPDDCAARLNEVNEARAEKSRQFFREHAGKFHAHQEQIASVELYTKEVLNTLGKHTPAAHFAAEIGPGEGYFLPSLASHFKRVIALDSSSEMLALAKSHVDDKKTSNIEWVHGDTSVLSNLSHQLDCQVINMVLHHVASPQQIFNDCFDAAKTGGILVLSDLCEHDQLWAKEACGDLWLGLNSEDILKWASHAGWKNLESSYFAQRNGFTIQLHCFYKPDNGSFFEQ
jgi:ArsR family transcriptional regulator